MNNHQPQQLVEHMFRHESGKLVSILTRIFGVKNLELAEDVVQDTLAKALEHWKFNGIPDNPTAWLFRVAKNKALDRVRRDRFKERFSNDLTELLQTETSDSIYDLPGGAGIRDEQLRMMFVCAHPVLPESSQVTLMLKTLCGFSTAEIARAFLAQEETVSKRLYRAREQFRAMNLPFSLPDPSELRERVGRVLTAVYLIFNEGYNSTHGNALVREELIEEALRLGKMICDEKQTALPEAYALLALMCFQAARVSSRVDASGNIVLLKHQDRKTWNAALIQTGEGYLNRSSAGYHVTSYHLEAAIAREHCIAARYEDTDWKKILQLYDWLLSLKKDPVVALNRLVIFGELYGPQKAIEELDRLEDREALQHFYLYHAIRGEWYAQLGDREKARACFGQAVRLTKAPAEQQLLQAKIIGMEE